MDSQTRYGRIKNLRKRAERDRAFKENNMIFYKVLNFSEMTGSDQYHNSTTVLMSFLQEIESIKDHRVDANKDYELADIIFLTIAVVLCGATGWKAIRIFGEAQLSWLRQYRSFSNGIPTRHSIERIIRGIKAESLVSSFISFSNSLRNKDDKEQIAFDGKVVRGSKHGDKIDALQLMTAMVVESDFVIYQKKNIVKPMKFRSCNQC